MINPKPRLTQAAIDAIGIVVGDRNPKINEISGPKADGNAIAVADATGKFLVTSGGGRKYVLTVSNREFPMSVGQAVGRLHEVRSVLGSENQSVVEMPIDQGSWDGASYALWRYRSPLKTDSLRAFTQKNLLAPKVRAWLSSVAMQTLQNNLTSDDIRTNFIEPLDTLISHPKADPALTGMAKLALGRLTSGDFRPVHVLQHGDLWLGNILIKGSLELLSPSRYGFIVIDWGGATVRGYPFFDLLTFSMSCSTPPRAAARHIDSMRNIIRCGAADVVCHVLCALGKLCQDLEHFPEHRFLYMCGTMTDYLAAAGFSMESPPGTAPA